jgi:hypothetical protein
MWLTALKKMVPEKLLDINLQGLCRRTAGELNS